MAEKKTLNGIVLNKVSREPYSGATVRFESQIEGSPASSKNIFLNTDENGKFSQDISDENLFPEGEYMLYVFHPDVQQEKQPLSVQIKNGTQPKELTIEMFSRQKVSSLAGYIFFGALGLVLIIAGGLYYQLHITYPNSLDPVISDLLDLSLMQADLPQDSASKAFNSQTLSIIDSVTRGELHSYHLDSPAYGKAVLALISQADSMARTNNKEEYKLLISQLQSMIQKKVGAYFWETQPKLLLEIFFWALFATLFRLIANTGFYLSRRSFFRDSIAHKCGLILTIPVIAVVIAFILSYIKFSFTLGDSILKIDMGDPVVVIILATLIGLAPWKAWEFLYSMADGLFKAMMNFVGKSDSPA